MPDGLSLATTSWTDAMNLRDAILERSIEIASLEFHCAQTPDERRTAWERMRSLISQRSPERVREMEIKKGLREK